MNFFKKLQTAVILSASITAGLFTSAASSNEYDPSSVLSEYIQKDDGIYKWEIVTTSEEALFNGYEMKLTSQQWLTNNEVSRSIWEHEVFIYVPKLLTLTPQAVDSAIMLVDGGSNTHDADFDSTYGQLATLYNKVIVQVKNVPNQPFSFTEDGEQGLEMKEDALIARTFDEYIDSGNAEWPIFLPMVKSVVKAMDASSEFLNQELKMNIEKFATIGASKRGWTTWLSAAVDDRIIGFVPAVIDALDLPKSFENQFESTGSYYPTIVDYTSLDIPCRLDSTRGRELLEIVDPISYQNRLKGKPKMIVNASSDQFFQNTNSLHYWDRVAEPKNLRYFPNTGHGLNINAIISGFGFASRVLDKDGKQFAPEIFWENDPDGELIVYSSAPPLFVDLYTANNPSLDFRLDQIGEEAWSKERLNILNYGIKWLDRNNNGIKEMYYVFKKEIEAPSSGYVGFYFSLNFGISTYSTSIYTTPNTLPFEGQHCQ